MSARGITLSLAEQAAYHDGISSVFRFRATAGEAVAMPREVFAYRALPIAPGAAEALAVFDHVCSPSDLDDYPVGAPAPGAVPPWFRLDFCDLQFRARTLARATWDKIQADVALLIASLDAADALADAGSVRIGAAIPPGDSAFSSDGSL